MKRKRTIATKIIVPVFIAVLLCETAISLSGFYIYQNNNEETYREENKKPTMGLNETFNSVLIIDTFDSMHTIYLNNTPAKSITEMTDEERLAYYDKYNDITKKTDEEDKSGYYSFYEILFYGSTSASNSDGVYIGFTDKINNRFVCLFSMDKSTDVVSIYTIGYFFDLPKIVADCEEQGKTAYDGVKYNHNSVKMFGSGIKMDLLTNEDCWIPFEQKTSVINKSLDTFMMFFFGSTGMITAIILISLYSLLNRYAIKKIRFLSLRSQEYTESLKKGEFKDIFQKSNKRPDEIITLNDSFYYLDMEMRNYVKKVSDSAKASEKLQSELALAKGIQLGALPKNNIHSNFLSLQAFIMPAKEVGGDLYGYGDLENEILYFFIGDVSGKGVLAALFMMQAKTLLQENLANNDLLMAV
jgi:hypothetical protein